VHRYLVLTLANQQCSFTSSSEIGHQTARSDGFRKILTAANVVRRIVASLKSDMAFPPVDTAEEICPAYSFLNVYAVLEQNISWAVGGLDLRYGRLFEKQRTIRRVVIPVNGVRRCPKFGEEFRPSYEC
jgi:hypothetical protein